MQSVSDNHRWPEPKGPSTADKAIVAEQRSPKPLTDRSVTLESSILTLDEAAKILRVSKYSVYRFIWAKKLRTIKIGRRRLVPLQSLHELVEQLRAEETA